MMIEVTRGCLIIVEFKNDVINDLQSDSLQLWVSKTWQVWPNSVYCIYV